MIMYPTGLFTSVYQSVALVYLKCSFKIGICVTKMKGSAVFATEDIYNIKYLKPQLIML